MLLPVPLEFQNRQYGATGITQCYTSSLPVHGSGDGGLSSPVQGSGDGGLSSPVQGSGDGRLSSPV